MRQICAARARFEKQTHLGSSNESRIGLDGQRTFYVFAFVRAESATICQLVDVKYKMRTVSFNLKLHLGKNQL